MTTQTTQTTQTSGRQPNGQCPVNHGSLSQRKMPFAHEAGAAPIERDANGVWQVRDYDIAKRVLRSSQTQQAGFGADMVRGLPEAFVSKQPVLYQDGQAHREQRAAIARYFTPKATRENYHELMERLATEMIATLHREDRVELSDLSMQMATAVAAQVVGLTDSLLPGMEGRINRFITGNAERGISEAGQDPEQKTTRSPRSLLNFARNQVNMGSFLYLDVKPAIRARKRQPQDDVITHLIAQEYNDAEILIECVTYGTAGMVTTREFIVIAAWHLLENEALRQQYLAAEEEARQQILEEILRVEPIVGNLYRRTTEDVEVEVNGEPLTIPAGDLIDLHIYAVNADVSVVGEQPTAVCPMRELEKRAQPPVISFGDGAHRCPGAYIAIQESDIFLHKLLSIQGLRLVSEPRVEYKALVKGYEVRNFILAVGEEAA